MPNLSLRTFQEKTTEGDKTYAKSQKPTRILPYVLIARVSIRHADIEACANLFAYCQLGEMQAHEWFTMKNNQWFFLQLLAPKTICACQVKCKDIFHG